MFVASVILLSLTQIPNHQSLRSINYPSSPSRQPCNTWPVKAAAHASGLQDGGGRSLRGHAWAGVGSGVYVIIIFFKLVKSLLFQLGMVRLVRAQLMYFVLWSVDQWLWGWVKLHTCCTLINQCAQEPLEVSTEPQTKWQCPHIATRDQHQVLKSQHIAQGARTLQVTHPLDVLPSVSPRMTIQFPSFCFIDIITKPLPNKVSYKQS